MKGKKRTKTKACVTGRNKPVRAAKHKTVRTSKASKKSLAKPKGAAGGIFKGATEISLTENKIAVTRCMSHSAKGSFVQTETRTYHDITPANANALKKVVLSDDVKKITVKLK